MGKTENPEATCDATKRGKMKTLFRIQIASMLITLLCTVIMFTIEPQDVNETTILTLTVIGVMSVFVMVGSLYVELDKTFKKNRKD